MAGFMLLSFAVNDLVIFLILYAKPLYRFLFSFGLPQAIGAAVACPERKVVCIHVDGGAM